MTEPDLADILGLVAWRSRLSEARLVSLYTCARRADQLELEGDLVECGCERGGSAACLALSSPQRHLWVFDSFQGLPEPGPQDPPEADEYVGACVCSMEHVRKWFAELGLGNVTIIPGWFADTLSPAEIEMIAVLHLDCDWYASVRLCLEAFYDRVVTGGYIQIDDYGRWAGCRRAVDDFLNERGAVPLLERIDDTGRLLIKE